MGLNREDAPGVKLNIKFSVEQLREEIETLRGQVEDEQGNGDMLQRGLFRNLFNILRVS